MVRMNRWLIAIVALFITGQALSLSLPSIFGGKKDVLEKFQQHAPADTLFYFDGITDQDVIAISGQLNKSSIGQMDTVIQEFKLESGQDSIPALDFISYVLNDLVEQMSIGPKAMRDRYGLSKDFASAVYMDGIVPVVQFAVDSDKPLINVVDEASTEAGLDYQIENWGDHQVRVWSFNASPTSELDGGLALAFNDGLATLSFYLNSDSLQRKQQRLGLAKEKDSLAGQEAMQDLRKTYRFDQTLAGFINIEQIGRMLLYPNSTRAGQDLLTLGYDDHQQFDQVCLTEQLQFIQSVPRLVMGNERYEVRNNRIEFDTLAVLEMKDKPTVIELKRLNGHLSKTSLAAEDKLGSIDFGMNMDALVPVVTSLWQRFTSNTYQCPNLQQAQQQAKQWNPATLGLVTAMTQGIKGTSLTLFDLSIRDLATQQFDFDVLLSVAAENPAVLAGLVSGAPQLGGVIIPTDGQAVTLKVPSVPEDLQPKMAVRGKHLVLFSGEKATQASNKLTSEKLNNDGLMRLSFNYSKLGDLVDEVLPQVTSVTEFEASECAELYMSTATLRMLDGQFTMTHQMTDVGSEFQVDGNLMVEQLGKQGGFQAGTYDLESLDYGCEWIPVGQETIQANGAGQYSLNDDTDSCLVYQADYEWLKKGQSLTFNETKASSRDSCSDAFIDEESTTYSCTLITEEKNGFTCLFQFGDGDNELYRYTRQ